MEVEGTTEEEGGKVARSCKQKGIKGGRGVKRVDINCLFTFKSTQRSGAA